MEYGGVKERGSVMTITTTATVEKEGTLILTDLPLRAGDRVVVTIASAVATQPAIDPESLKGCTLHYDDPFGPATPLEDWEALR